MLFNTKPLLYLQLLDKSLRYMAVHPKTHALLEKDEIIFETNVLEEGKIVNQSLLETRLDILVREKKWRNAKTHVLLLKDFVTVRKVSVPLQLAEAEIKNYLTLHINRSIRMPFENPIFAYELLDKNEEEQNIVLVAYPRQYVEQYQSILQNVSLKPEVADISSFALYRLATAQPDITLDANQHTMILQWNPYDTNVMVFHQGLPMFNRFTISQRVSDSWEIQTDGEWQWKQSEEELGWVLDEQLDALGRFLDFYRYSVLDGDEQITEIVLTGYYPNLAQLQELLTDRFDVEVKVLTLPDQIEHRFSALYGLTMRDKDKGGRAK